MDLTNPANAVAPSLDAVVLAVLAGTSRPLTGRQVQRICGRSQWGVQTVLSRMVRHGLVDSVEAGSARLYTLNREHVAADAAIILSDLRGRLFQRMKDHLERWPVAPLAAAVFGSAARGDGGPDSDIDVLIVRPTDVMADDPRWGASVDDLSRAILAWSGNHASIIQASPEQVGEMVERAEPLVEALKREAVPITELEVLGVLRK
jgi:hypothetical protein